MGDRHQSLDRTKLLKLQQKMKNRPRSNTISHPTPESTLFKEEGERVSREAAARNSINIAMFLFLQQHHLPFFTSKAVPLNENLGSVVVQTSHNSQGQVKGPSDLERALKVLDSIPALDTHKIGIVYVGKGQKTGPEILSNGFGSHRYMTFLDTIGQMVRLKDNSEYCGGLDTKEDRDGKYTYVWQGDITRVVYHVATLMPSMKGDEQQINKKRFIGNDHVTIVFNENSEPFKRETLAGAVNFVYIVVQPLDEENFRVSINIKDGMDEVISSKDDRVISNEAVGLYVRQLAIHSNLASLVHRSGAGNWMERLKQIKLIGQKHSITKTSAVEEDFTSFLES